MTVRMVVLFMTCLACADAASAQTLPSAPASEPAQPPASTATRPESTIQGSPVDGIEQWLHKINNKEKTWSPLVGSVASGGGLAFGQALRQPLFGRTSLTTDMLLSTKGYHTVGLALEFPKWRKVTFSTQFRYDGLPQEDFFGVGRTSREQDHSGYMRQGVDLSLVGAISPRPWLNIEARAGYLHNRLTRGRQNGIADITDRFDATTAPGLRGESRFAHVGVAATVDRTDDTFFPRGGGFYRGELTNYLGLDNTAGRTLRLDLDARRYIALPKLTNHVLAVRSVVSLSRTDGDAPFYLMPRVGGGTSLRGYDTSRFTDNHAFVLSGEYRWLALRNLQLVAFADAGQVAPSVSSFAFEEFHRSVGGGIRYRFKDAVIRMDVARGKEGVRWHVGFGPSF